MKLNDCIKIESHEQLGVAGPLWKVQVDYQGLRVCGVGGNRESLLRNVDRKIENMADDLKIIATLLGQEAANATP